MTEEVKDEVGDAFAWSFAGKRRLKNVKEPVALFRARRAEADRRRHVGGDGGGAEALDAGGRR